MKTSKKLIVMLMILVGLGVTSTVFGWYVGTPITDVTITSPDDGDTVFAGGEYTVTCSTSTDHDRTCQSQAGSSVPDNSITHTWSGDGSFSPTTGTSATWTAPTATGSVTITVTADDLNTVKFDDDATTDSIDLTVTNIIYVDLDKTSGNNDGTSWANAFLSLQDALAAADDAGVSANEIWVAEGTYFPDDGTNQTPDSRSESFELVDGIDVYGGFEGIAAEDERGDRDWFANETILSGDIDDDGSLLDGDNSYHVVKGADNVTLDGLTITGGYADGTTADGNAYGGGVYNSSVDLLTVSNCIIKDNYADELGGGMYSEGTISLPTDVEINNCLFIGNQAGDGGGAFNVSYSDNRFKNCTFTENDAISYGGGVCSYYSVSVTEIVNSILYGNTDYTPNDHDVVAVLEAEISISYSDVDEYGSQHDGSFTIEGLIDVDPLFADSANGDYHLKSSTTNGRKTSTGWTTDAVTSLCINAGDSDTVTEPTPNGSRVNMGYYGNTAEASKSSVTYPTTSPISTNIIYVDLDKTSGNNDGSTWANAFLSLQDALAAALWIGDSSKEIWVAEGTYFPDDGTYHSTDLRTETFELVAGIDVYGGFEGIAAEDERGDRNWFDHETILSGNIGNSGLDTDNSYHVVTGDDNLVLDGFTITGGYADGTGADDGAGIYNICISLTVSNCIIQDNHAEHHGGGIYNYGTQSIPTDAIISNCLIYDNDAGYGAGVFAQGSSYNRVENCTFSNNDASSYGGAIYSANLDRETEIVNSIFWDNTDGNFGDCDIISDRTEVIISYSDFNNNETLNGGTFDPGSGNLSTNPLFAGSGDYHLKSEAIDGRKTSSGWTQDGDHSPCIDAGDTASSYSNEPTPNGSRINMGYYGNTAEASKTP